MSEVEKEIETTAAAPAAEVKKSPKPKAKKAAKSLHPTTATMVQTAITDLKERGGSSLQAIKKYISSTYYIDSDKFAPFIKKYIKASVASGVLVQTKGKGASGSFKLATVAVTKPRASNRPQRGVNKSPKEAKPKKTKKAAKSKAKAAKPAEKKAAPKPNKKAPAKSVSKSTKKAKSPAKKPKAPKPKTTKATGKKK